MSLSENHGAPRATPLTPQQRRLWHVGGADAPAAFRTHCALLLEGPLDPAALEAALADVVRSRDALDTAWRAGERVPLAATARRVDWLPAADLSGRAGFDLRTAPDALLDAVPAGSADGPLLRARLATLGPERNLLVLDLPALCADAPAVAIVARETARAYAAQLAGTRFHSDALSYDAVSEWLDELLASDDAAPGRAYWRAQRELWQQPNELPFTAPQPAPPPLTWACERFGLDEGGVQAVEALARTAGVAPHVVLLAAFKLLLWRLCGGADTVVGVACDGRTEPDLEDVVGALVRYLPVRSEPRAGVRVLDLVHAVDAACRMAQTWQDCFDWRLDAGDRDEPACRFGFDYREEPEPWRAGALTFTLLECDARAERCDLRLSWSRRASALDAKLHYDASRVASDDVAQLARACRTVLAAMAARPDADVASLGLLDEAQRRRVLVEWNATAVAYPRERCLHELFEEQARRTPQATAVVWADQRLGFGELDARAERLARRLRESGVGPEARVGLFLERSPEAIVGLLAILKAGGAYLPLDPELPLERLEFMLDDAAAAVVLTTSGLLDRLPASTFGRTLCLDDDGGGGAPLSDAGSQPPVPQLRPDNLAYVMYTSGSTGTPKAIEVTHRNVVRLIVGADYARFGPQEVFLQLAPLSFDASTFEIWGSLLSGATLALPPAEAGSLHEIAAALERYGVTTLWLTAGLYHLMLDQQPEALARVACVLAGGEALSPAHVRRHLEICGAGRVVNGYGPTETTTFACCHVMDCTSVVGDSVPIGRPVANTQVYLLDRQLAPVLPGSLGEIFIGGDGVARGYGGRPDATAERFVPDPFAPQPGGRLYRSGDLARQRPDGTLEFHGRLDDQVKLRGFRIEPGEIEAALAACPGVRAAAVMVRADAGTGPQLVAYVVPDGPPLATAALRAALAQRLPPYMVPSAYVPLGELPLTRNGKVDRRSLPAPERVTGERAAAPLGMPVEELLAGVFAEVLGVERVSRDDGFFELGGHSLLATQAVSRIREVLGVELPLRALFEAPSVAGLAARVEDARSGDGRPELPAWRRGNGQDLALSYAQQRLWFLEQLEPGSPLYNCAAAVRLRGRLDAGALERTLSEIVRRHEALRTRFRNAAGQAVPELGPPEALHVEIHDLSGLDDAARDSELRRLAREEALRPFDLARDLLLRGRLVRLGEEEHVFLFTVHHIASDGWSLEVLVREVSALYDAFARGAESPLAELELQYSDYAAWQREWFAGGALERQVAYWKQRLAGAPAVLELPTDHARPGVRKWLGARRRFTLPEPLMRGLERLSRRQGTTLFMTVLAAFQTLLSRLSRQDDVVVGTPIANRTHQQIEGLIGFFVNTLALRTDLSGDPTFAELLERVRETALGAYAHQDLPFERLVEALNPARGLSHTPVFQVLFALRPSPLRCELPELVIEVLDDEAATVRFDLELVISAQADGGARGEWLYDAELFEPESIERLTGHLLALLERAAEDPTRSLSELTLLSDDERRQVAAWGGTAWETAGRACLQTLFEAQVQRTPEAVALVCGETSLSYGELNRRANRLAHELRARGVARDVPVGLCLERTPELVVGLLAILKAGGAYVPIEPRYPAERQAYMLDDSGVRLLLTRGALGASLPRGRAELLDVDALAGAGASDANPACVTTPDDLAYLIYTSGSTGRPKAVMVEHGNVTSTLAAAQREFAFGAGDVMPGLASFAFDIFLFELFGPLLCGGTAVLIDEVTLLEPRRLIEALRPCTLLHAVPALMRQIVDTLRAPGLADRCAGLRHVFTGGDSVPPALLEDLCAALPRARVWVLYGPTETAIICSRQPVSAGAVARRHLIGSRFDNATLRVCDERLRCAPIGVPGEICVGGAGVTRGYLNRPELTRERYVEIDGQRCYRTGDLGRLRSDGVLEFLGRTDDQVKVRGFRVELGEVEAALSACPEVHEAVAGLRPGADGQPRLVAWAVATDGESFDPLAVLGTLRARLPEYMVPSVLTAVPSLPLTPNGKVDRRALPEPEQARPELRATYVAPRNETEALLAPLFAQALGLEQVGVHDNFFELGGHSLTATRLMASVRAACGREVPLRRLFEAPTVAGLAPSLDDALIPSRVGGGPGVAPVARGSGDLDSLLDEIEGLSDDDVQGLLDSRDSAAREPAVSGDSQRHEPNL